ncbi:hypothetical protein NHX12_022045 [Muraenolepis orangiensis]|uniref:Uncharacterized protein n=1 Tax=Muraenolepis orangiensis TaxID=630683 RepID=A0A9Q0EMY6_9TELE|nr:hypothetical protein NHX12_022045 [Muraenolepis orangiensis]
MTTKGSCCGREREREVGCKERRGRRGGRRREEGGGGRRREEEGGGGDGGEVEGRGILLFSFEAVAAGLRRSSGRFRPWGCRLPTSALEHSPDSISFEHTHRRQEADWTALKTMLHSIALETLAVPIHQDWFDENNAGIQALLDEKHHIQKAYLNDSSSSLKKTAFPAETQSHVRQLAVHKS